MNPAIKAIIRKDFRSITANRKLFSTMLIVPLCLTVLLPSIFILVSHFAPDDPDMQKLLSLLPAGAGAESLQLTLASLILNYILPVFFLMIPIMTSSITAASSFVGEKEKRTLETLLYCPLSVQQIFRAKVLASFLLSMLVSFLSFAAMLLFVELEAYFLMHGLLRPSLHWLLILLLLAPSLSLIAVTLIVRGSAKAKSVEESQQSAVFLILPLILLMVGQFSGALLLSTLFLLGLSVLCLFLAVLLLRKALRRFTYEMLLQNTSPSTQSRR